MSESPDTLITDIGVGKQQLVEIAKALNKSVKLLILDEPTAALNESDSQHLLDLILGLKGRGITSIIISHKLNEIEQIADHLYTAGQPDPDLIIRTSGEQRLSGFLLWQSAHSEFYFCEALWPDFRKVDFIRALRAYGQRERRFGA